MGRFKNGNEVRLNQANKEEIKVRRNNWLVEERVFVRVPMNSHKSNCPLFNEGLVYANI